MLLSFHRDSKIGLLLLEAILLDLTIVLFCFIPPGSLASVLVGL
jgi:hypothetical protein